MMSTTGTTTATTYGTSTRGTTQLSSRERSQQYSMYYTEKIRLPTVGGNNDMLMLTTTYLRVREAT
jgi:hypothetical protein